MGVDEIFEAGIVSVGEGVKTEGVGNSGGAGGITSG